MRISCRGGDAGRCAVSTHRDPLGGWQPFENEVFVVSLGDARVERLAHHHSDPGFVAAQPVASCETSPDAVLANASLSRDARHVLFTSNWNAHCFGELYLVQR